MSYHNSDPASSSPASTATLIKAINQMVAFRTTLDEYFSVCNLSAGEKSSLSRKTNDLIRQLEKIRTQLN